MKKGGAQPSRLHPSKSFLHQRRQLHEHIGYPAPQLFIVPLEPGDLLRVHAEGIGMDGHLIEIVGTPPLERYQLPDEGKVNMEDIAV